MMLGIDIGSSSVKCGLLRGSRLSGPVASESFATRFADGRAEVRPDGILRALGRALQTLGPTARRAEVIGLSTLSPSWLAMDRRGRPLTPIITHQDRRSVAIAGELEARIGADRHLQRVGNRPFPGGISSTTAAWFSAHQPQVLQQADLLGHLSTFLHRQLTGERVIDPSQASFTGLFDVVGLSGWDDELCDAVGVRRGQLPHIIDGNRVAGRLTSVAAERLGLTEGTPMLAGVVDGSAAMRLSGAKVGQLMNVAGSTDVLALVTNQPTPHRRLLTRSLGIGRKWLSVSTLAAAGSAIEWARRELFRDLSWPEFARKARRAARSGSRLEFTADLGGDRMSIEQKTATLSGLTLASSRDDILAALLDGLSEASARRLEDLAVNPVRPRRKVFVTGGVMKVTGAVMYRNWPGHWSFHYEADATLRGLGTMV